MSDQQRFVFTGTGGPAECQEFIRFVRQQAVEGNKARDNDWIADYAASCITGSALEWFEDLDEEVSLDWKLLRRALLMKYNHNAQGSSIVPTPAAAPPASTGITVIPSNTPIVRQAQATIVQPNVQPGHSQAPFIPISTDLTPRRGLIRVFMKNRSGPTYLMESQDPSTKGCGILTVLAIQSLQFERRKNDDNSGERLATQIDNGNFALGFVWGEKTYLGVITSVPSDRNGRGVMQNLALGPQKYSLFDRGTEVLRADILSDGTLILGSKALATVNPFQVTIYRTSGVEVVVLYWEGMLLLSEIALPDGRKLEYVGQASLKVESV